MSFLKASVLSAGMALAMLTGALAQGTGGALTSKVNAGPTKYHNAAPIQGGADYKKNYECFTDEGYGRKLSCSYSTSGP